MKNITWEILTREALCELYQNEMQRDFPPDELRPLKTLLELYDTGRYCPYGVFAAEDGDDSAGSAKTITAVCDDDSAGSADALAAHCTDAAPAKPSTHNPLIAYLNVVHASGCDVAFLDYFATSPALRGAGLGAALLQTLYETETARGATALLWEAETPTEAPDPAMAARRMGFYNRAGGQPTNLRQQVYGVWFDSLCHPCAGSLTPAQTEQALLHIYHQLMNPTVFAREYRLIHTDASAAD